MQHTDENRQFSPMPMPRREMPELEVSHYHVYRNHEEYVIVEAISAVEAMRLAGVRFPHRVVRDMPMHRAILATHWLGIEAEGKENLKTFQHKSLLQELKNGASAPDAPNDATAATEALSTPAEAPVEGATAVSTEAPATPDEAKPAEATSQDDIDKLFG